MSLLTCVFVIITTCAAVRMVYGAENAKEFIKVVGLCLLGSIVIGLFLYLLVPADFTGVPSIKKVCTDDLQYWKIEDQGTIRMTEQEAIKYCADK